MFRIRKIIYNGITYRVRKGQEREFWQEFLQ